jgi:membrane protease YdiL (CAAX protease family)
VSVAFSHPIPDDARTPLGWADLLYLVLFYLGAGVFFVLGASGVISREIIAQGVLLCATLCFLFLLVRVRSGAPFWWTIGWRPFHGSSRGASVASYVALGLMLAVGVQILANALGQSSQVPMEELFRTPRTVLMMAVLSTFMAPLVEEVFFRGCMYPVIAGRFGVATSVLVTGTIFGLVHAPQLGFDWREVTPMIVVGIVLTFVRARAGTVAASYFVHLSYNTVIFVGFFWATHGLRHLPGS